MALVWNDRVEEAPAMRALAEVNRAYCPAFKDFSGGTLAPGARGFANFFRDGHFTERKFPFAVEQTVDEFVGRALSSSYASRPGEAGHDAYVTALREVFGRFAEGARLTTPMVCRAYRG